MDLGNIASQGLCQNNIASILVIQGHYDDALTYFQQAVQTREKSGVSTNVAESLQGLPTRRSRSANSTRPSQIISVRWIYFASRAILRVPLAFVWHGDDVGESGRYGAALDAQSDALKTFRDAGDKRWLMDALNGYAGTLVMLGRSAPAREALKEASAIVKELKAANLIAST